MKDKSGVAKHIKMCVEITEIMRQCETVSESYDVLSNVTMNFFLMGTKPGRTLAAFKEYCTNLKDKLIAAEEEGVKSMIDDLKKSSEEEIESLLQGLKKTFGKIDEGVSLNEKNIEEILKGLKKGARDLFRDN